MISDESKHLTPAVVGITGLAAEYCSLVEDCAALAPRQLCGKLSEYLPRIYISISSLGLADGDDGEEGYIAADLNEDTYNSVRASLAAQFGEYDMYLDTPVEDMQYSDTPVAVSLSEKLADIYQNMYDLVSTMRSAPAEAYADVLIELKNRFNSYLSETLCDAFRTVNFLYRKQVFE